jgi:hypothetical protein
MTRGRGISRSALPIALAIFALIGGATPTIAQIYSSAVPEIAHDISPILAGLSGVNPPSCPQQPAQLLPNSTGLTIDQNFRAQGPTTSGLDEARVCI